MNRYVKIYKALADETRLRILALLFAEGELCVCDIFAALALPQSTVSRHLAYLRKAGLVNDRRCGLWIYYSLRDSGTGLQGLAPILKDQLLATPVSATDREVLASIGKGDRCT